MIVFSCSYIWLCYIFPFPCFTDVCFNCLFIHLLVLCSGRGKPGWGKESTRPPWWPKDLPWANVRMDARSEEEKQKISWTHALRQIVINCYKFHGREDLLPAFNEDDDNKSTIAGPTTTIKVHKISSQHVSSSSSAQQQVAHVPQILKLECSLHISKIIEIIIIIVLLKFGTMSSVQYEYFCLNCYVNVYMSNLGHLFQVATQYASAVLQTISNPDGTVSIIQVDPNNPIITLPDGTTAQVQGVATGELPAVFQIHTTPGQDGGPPTVHAVQALTEVTHGADGQSVAVDLNSVTEATLNQDGQLILTGEDGHGCVLKLYRGYPVSVSGMITMPVPGSMYQTVVANIQQIHSQADGTTMQVVTPVVQTVPKVEGGNGDNVETITVTPGGMVVGQEGQVLQVLSLKEAQQLKAAAAGNSPSSPPTTEIKEEEVIVIAPASSPEN
ncbi:hypothetical protein B566_EDAN006697 [Ephemera danica]|nr:hypothetical protein B566_EDAN006697 [Ephemera danica]